MGADVGIAAVEEFGPYRVYERLGVGGMATVHRAIERASDDGLERVVALKRLLPHLAEDASFIKAFVREAKLASLLAHVNIVEIYELGRVGTEYFISMEYIDGRDVRRVLRHARKVTGPPPIHITVGIVLQLCEALDYAHHKVDDDGSPLGLVHRDVSPSNLILTSAGQLKVIDFGIAKAQSSQLRTQTGRVKGKLAYMAPEAVSGSRELDARSDVWAAGVILHELLTARPLFASKNEYQTLLKVQRGDIMPPSTFNQGCPQELDAIVFRALARDPDERYDGAAALRDELLDVCDRYQLHTDVHTVAKWLEWAFSLETPAGFSGNTLEQSQISPVSRVNTPAPSADDDDAVELVWGTGEPDHGSGPVVLDDVPDVSAKHRRAPTPTDDELDEMPTPQPGLVGSPPALEDPFSDDPGEARDTLVSMPVELVDAAVSALDPPQSGLAPLRPAPRTKPGVAPAAKPKDRPSLAPATQKPVFGTDAIGARRSPRSTWIAVIGLLLIAGGAAALAMFAMTARDHARHAEPPPPPSRDPGTVKFITEPADAEIDIESQGDGQRHTGSPWSIDLAPGPHQIEIHRSGYKGWLTAIELSARETQTFHVVLLPLGKVAPNADATLSVTTSPPDLEAVLDGHVLSQHTPVKVTIKIGTHVIAVRSAGIELWRQTVTAEPSSDYEFNPTFSAEKLSAPAPSPTGEVRPEQLEPMPPPAPVPALPAMPVPIPSTR